MKKLLLSILMIVLPVLASAYDACIDGIYYNFNGETASVTYYDEYNYGASYSGDVIVPESVTYDGKTYRVTSIGYCAFNECRNLTYVDIPNSVTTIADWAFSDCSNLTSVNIPNNVNIIGDYAFKSCNKLISVTIPNNVTSIGDYAFYGCI